MLSTQIAGFPRQPAKPPAAPLQPAATDRASPSAPEAEEHVLSCCLIEGSDTFTKAVDQGVTEQSFFSPANRAIWAAIRRLGDQANLATLVQELKSGGLLEAVGGVGPLMELERSAGTTTRANYFIAKLREAEIKRDLIRQSTNLIEHAYNGSSVEELREIVSELQSSPSIARIRPKLKGIMEFGLIPDGDKSILLGDRYLNRGDAGVLVSTSGMGKSAIACQIAIELALNRGPFGLQGNGPLKSLIVQSEDSDGDVGEVAQSIGHVLKLTPEQIQDVNSRVKLTTDRVNRGARFVESLRRLIAEFKPDLVIINPFQAFMDGDVTDSKDLGSFLREGLNSLNEPATFAYLVIHHTTKPAKIQAKGATSSPNWNEIMYDMAGGAEIINWARAVINLRAGSVEGEFNLVLSKRGRRAGVTRKVPQGTGYILEPVTTIPLKHATGRIDFPGIKRGLPLIYWEPREPDAPPIKPENMAGRPEKYLFKNYRNIFPPKSGPGVPLNQLYTALLPNGEIKKNNLHAVCERWAEAGDVEIIDQSGQPRRYRACL